MHVWSLPLTSAQPLPSDPNPNWNWVLQIGLTVILIGLGFLHLLRSTTSKYLLSHPNYSSSSSSSSSSMAVPDSCAVCGKPTSKQCAACKSVKYCSQTCQVEHWKSEHKRTCKELKSSGRVKTQLSPAYGKHKSSVALVPSSGPDRTQKLVDKVLFPYDEFVKLFNWDKQIFPPCGLLNCGNSCFANVVLQCLAHTRPLIAYLLDKGHRRDCRRNEWCFFCELQMHMERASRGQQPFSPINILSRLPTIGGNLGNGKQEDAHEFMRFAIDKMQSVCLDEHGGEKVIHPKAQETTLIQHIFGGQLQSQVVCTQCNQVSRQYENMMDLTVEIQGDATSLEECLDQFTMKEWLHGDNLYKCDGCNDYVRAWKRLTIHQAPNILTIALKRFQSGRFGKINKRITFPETLDLSPYMSEGRDGTDIYKLYAVVVHVDMLNASFFGHYICYTKGFQGDWYRIDDCKVMRVELDEVLSQGAYMLMYSRVSARPTCLKTFESATKHKQEEKVDSASSDGSIEDYGVVNPASGLPASLDTLENRIDTSKAETLNPHHARVSLNFPRSGEQSTSEVSDSFGSSALGVNVACDTSDNASGADSMSLEVTDAFITVNGVQASAGELVGAGHRSEDGPTVCGNGNDGNIAGVKGGRKAAAFEETTSCEDTCIGDDITGVREDADDMELEDAEVNERCNGAADGMIMNRKVVSSCLDPDEKSSQV